MFKKFPIVLALLIVSGAQIASDSSSESQEKEKRKVTMQDVVNSPKGQESATREDIFGYLDRLGIRESVLHGDLKQNFGSNEAIQRCIHVDTLKRDLGMTRLNRCDKLSVVKAIAENISAQSNFEPDKNIIEEFEKIKRELVSSQ